MPVTKVGSNVFVVGGDNSSREFSGWQRGINTLASLQCYYDIVLIANDMFLKPGPSFLQDYAAHALLKKSLSEKKIIGRIDTSSQDYTLFGYDVSSWVCTNCVFIPEKAVEALGDIVLVDDNIHEIIRHNYDLHHLMRRKHFSLRSGAGDFYMECDMPGGHHNREIRIKFDAAADQHSLMPIDDRPRIAMIEEITLNNQALSDECFVRGIFSDQGTIWAEQSFLLDLPLEDDAHSSRLVVKGYYLPEACRKVFNNEVRMTIYNDTVIYQENAPINKNYRRWIIEWLTEKWHSRFEINPDTWEFFKTKAAAIFNESLLTAKFKELGYPPETYGNKKYY
ncbi:hypothetical protein ACOHYD_10210 [Desulfobacterota bacterium M19]